MKQLTITRPDDWHVHLRDGDYLKTTVSDISRYFGRAIIMPNLDPPVLTLDHARAYRDRIKSLIPQASCFEPLMTLYLSDETSPETIGAAKDSGFIHALKLYPAGATTNSQAGVKGIQALYPLFETMETKDMCLSIHGEVTDSHIDIFDREQVFIDRFLEPICRSFPRLRIVLEHITTKDAAKFVEQASEKLAATITAHHLLYNRNHMLADGLKPLYYCLPVLKRNTHQQALIDAAISGNPKFFLGTDSAPHTLGSKSSICGCAAGCYTAHAAIELYAEVFEKHNALDKLEGFASFHGADFYGVGRNRDTIRLTKQAWRTPSQLSFGHETLVPLPSDTTVNWTVKP